MTTTTSIQRIAMALAAGTLVVAGLSACVPLVVGGAAVGTGMVSTDRRSTGAQVDDQAIELRGAARIRDIANDQMYVSITSFNRQVLLTGTVGSEADRRRAEEVVAKVDNVRSVVNALVVGPPLSFQQHSNDTYISGKVKVSMLDAKDIFANSFKIVTSNSVVYLMGLATRRETERASDIARGVDGVTKVVRVVEIISEADLAAQVQQPAPTSSAPASAPATSGSRSNVPLPPMEPLPPLNPAPASGGVSTSPVR